MREFEYLTVHEDLMLFPIFLSDNSGGVKGFAHFGGVPFVFGERPVIIGANYGVFTLS